MTRFRARAGLARAVLGICVLLAGCGGQAAQEMKLDEAQAAGPALAEAGERDCPWPAGLDEYAETAPAGRDRDHAGPGAAAFEGLQPGCAMLTFTLTDAGVAGRVQVVNENPPGFGKLAVRALRSYDYATGADTSTRFVVRIGARLLPSGAALLQMAFKDRPINVVVPR